MFQNKKVRIIIFITLLVLVGGGILLFNYKKNNEPITYQMPEVNFPAGPRVTLSFPRSAFNKVIGRRTAQAAVKLINPYNEEVTDNLGVSWDSSGDKINLSLSSRTSAFRAGKYQVTVFDKNDPDRKIIQDFSWGVLALNTNKSIYNLGDTIEFSIGVLNEKGKMVCDARTKLTVVLPDGSEQVLSTEDNTIIINPECQVHDVTYRPDYEASMVATMPGRYKLTLSAVSPNGQYQISDFIEVWDSVPFAIERETATRIFPLRSYTVNIDVVAHEDFAGYAVEKMSGYFKVKQLEKVSIDFEEIVVNGDRYLVWPVSVAAGEKLELKYIYNAPQISPEFYLLGPLRLITGECDVINNRSCLVNNVYTVFSELRQWQIASDSVITYQQGDGKGTPSDTDDTYISNGAVTTNYGTAITCEIDTSTNHKHCFIKFPNIFGIGVDQIPLGSTINSATTTLYVDNATDVNPTVYQVTEAWSESQATWNDRLTGTAWSDTGGDGTSSHKATSEGDFPCTSTGYYDLAVTTSLQDWSNSAINEGWIFTDNSTNGCDFRSSEATTAANRPKLTVDYTTNGHISETGNNTSNGSSNSPSITHGLTINENDVVVVVVHANGNPAISDNNGADAFTEEFEEGGADTSQYAIYYRVAGASEPATYNFSLSSSQSWSLVLRVFSGVDTLNVWDVAPSATTRNNGTSGTAATAPSMTINTSGAVGLLVTMSDSTNTWSNPTNGYGNEVENSTGRSLASYTRGFASAGSSGTASSTLSASNDWIAQQFALKPSVASNSQPTLTSVSDSPDPVAAGADITFSVDWNDADSGEMIKAHICKTDAISGGACSGGSWCDSPVFTNRDPDSCTYTTTANETATSSVDVQISQSSDDAEECKSTGNLTLTSTDLDLVTDDNPQCGDANQKVGLRWQNITIPPGAVVTSAYIEFQEDEADTESTSLTFWAEDADNASTFTTDNGNLSSRTTTTAEVTWSNVPSWAAGTAKHQTPDLSPLIQEVVDRPGWSSGNSLAIIIDGSGSRVAEAQDGTYAPRLYIEYIANNYYVFVCDDDGFCSSSTSSSFSVTQQSPTAPTALLTENLQSPALNIVTTTPKFSAVFNDPNPYDYMKKYCIEVDTASDFTGTNMWYADGNSCLTGVTTTLATSGWWNSSWTKRKKITFDTTGTATTTDLTNYPAAVQLNSSRIDYTNTQNSGQDIRFIDADGSTELNYEIEQWNESGTSTIWVQVPTITANSSTDHIWLYYGNTSATDNSTTTGVWDDNYVMVTHFAETSSSYLDSTKNNNDTTNFDTSTANGKLGRAVSDTNTSLNAANDPTLDGMSQLTLEAWVNMNAIDTSNGDYILRKRHSGSPWDSYGLNVDSGGHLRFHARNSGGGWNGSTGNTVLSTATWYYLSGVYDGSDLLVYVNAVSDEASPDSMTGTVYDSDSTLGMPGYASPDGTFDEFRISNTARSLDWLEFSYCSMDDGCTTYGSEEAQYTSAQDGQRSEDITYAGTALSLDASTYYWRMWFWDDSDNKSATSTTASFTMTSGSADLPRGVRWMGGRIKGGIRLK